MRVMTSEEVAKYRPVDPKYDRAIPFYPPDPDLIGKFFAVWVATDWYMSDMNSHDAERTTYSVFNECFGGFVIAASTRSVPNTRKYCHVCMLPVANLKIPDKGPFNLWIKMKPMSYNTRECFDPFQLVLNLMDRKTQEELWGDRNTVKTLVHDMYMANSQKTRKSLYDEMVTARNELYKQCAEWLFGQGSYVDTTNPDEWYLVTPFTFPPGYVWDTARALTGTFGDDSQFVRRFLELAVSSGSGTSKPDQWWLLCEDPWAVFMVLFSRMLGPERWRYTLACLESTFGSNVDWNGTL